MKIKIFLFVVLLSACSKKSDLHILMSNEETGLNFSNDLKFDDDFNVYKYRNFYNGGGVALGDINNDGLIDIYLTSNQNQNKLYLNKGNFKFKDISSQAGVSGEKAWATGVTMVDINADGLLDIYVCNSGDIKGDNKQNELYINNGDLTFTESASKYNLDDSGYSTHASFFDFDKDGDLDVYLLNNSYQSIGSFNLKKNERPKRDLLGGDKLMENRNNKFYDISEKANIYGSIIGFGLGVTVGDVNGDNWEDIFVSNDFFERDYLYINQKNGTFKEDLTSQMKSISGASMGADIADIDNNGANDIFVTEMLPSNYQRLKSVTTFETWDKYQYVLKNGYHHQFTRNMLHLNNSDNTFSEIGRFSGVEATDWSWGALFYDVDNDGLKDLFVANGIYKDLTNQDYLLYISNDEVVKSIVKNDKVDFRKLVEIIPSNPVPNHAFKNIDGINFEKFNNSGLDIPSFSNGSAYGDLDNDGDMDLVVNNVNMPVFIFQNQLNLKNNYIKFILNGIKSNKNAIGSKIKVTTKNGVTQIQELQPVRGFQSTVDNRLNFGTGNYLKVDVEVIWPYGGKTLIKDLDVNQTLELNEADANYNQENESYETQKNIFIKNKGFESYLHRENKYVDFNRERLIYQMCSNEGPNFSKGDINGDGKDELIVSASKGFVPQIFEKNGNSYNQINNNKNIFEKYKGAENSKILLFDADNDKDLDIYLASGGVENSIYSEDLYDRLLINDGKGNYRESNQKLPENGLRISTSVAISADIDNDGDEDLFVGERLKIGNYGLPGSGFILVNDGNGNFKNQTDMIAPGLKKIGMITDAVFADLNSDNSPDLIVVGEFMGINILLNQNGRFTPLSNNLSEEKGWWRSLLVEDLNNDDMLDILVSNHGLNSRFRATKSRPIKLYFNDFDKNGSAEGIICFSSEDGNEYPYALRQDLIGQIKSLKKKFPDFESFKDADITKIFDQNELKGSIVSEINTLETSLYLNIGDFNFEKVSLPNQVQFSPIYSMKSFDFDKDGDKDLLMGGNQFKSRPEMGIYDASYGIYLENNGEARFEFFNGGKGFFTKGEIRDIVIMDDNVIVARNNDSLSLFKF